MRFLRASFIWLTAGLLLNIPNAFCGAPSAEPSPEFEAARDAEVKGDWPGALLAYENLYDSTTTDEGTRAALRAKFAGLRPKVAPNTAPQKAGVWKVKAFAFRELDFTWKDKNGTNPHAQYRYREDEIERLRRGMAGFADRVWKYTDGSLRIDWELKVIETPLTKLDGRDSFWPGPDSCMPHLSDLKAGEMDTIMVFAKVSGDKRRGEVSGRVPQMLLGGAFGVLGRLTKQATYIGFNWGSGTAENEPDGEPMLHEWLHSAQWALDDFQGYPRGLMFTSDGGKMEGEQGGDPCYRRKRSEPSWMGFYEHLMRNHVTRRMWRELSVTRAPNNVWRPGYAGRVRQDAPLAWWRFAETNSQQAAKSAAGHHPGTYRSEVTWGNGPIPGGRAVRFDGRTALVEIPHEADFALNALSVEFWFKSTQRWDRAIWPGSATFVSKATASANSSDWTLNAGSRSAGRNHGLVVVSSGATTASGDARMFSRGRLNDGTWHHVVWTRAADGANKLFVDGRLADLADDGGGAITNARPIQVGGDALEKGSWFQGWMAELAIYDKVLEPTRVQVHFAAIRSPGTSELVSTSSWPAPRETIVFTNRAGLRWEVARFDEGWTLGTVSLPHKPVEAPARSGLICLRHRDTGEERWLAARQGGRIDARTARFSGEQQVDGCRFSFTFELKLHESLPAASIEPRWSVDKELKDWEVGLAYHEEFAHDWRVQSYPFVANSAQADIAPMRYCGVPGALIYRPDLSLVALFAINPQFDYLNPTNWTGQTGFHFKNGLGAPQFRAGGGRLSPGVQYEHPLQLFLSDAGDYAKAITALVRDWIEVNRYEVQPLKIRTADEALAIFIEGRRKTKMWYPGKGYRIQDAWAVIYMPESPGNAYLDYLIYEQTGEALWRQRALEIMDFFLKAQHADPADPHCGAVESHFNLDEGKFSSTDRGGNPGLKPDMNAMAARYALMLWQRVKQREGVDRRDWYEAAVRIADWIMRQQNTDGGLPQVVATPYSGRDISVVSGRALVAFPIIGRITGDARYGRFAEGLEQFLRRKAEDRLWFTGAHTDLPPGDFEADSVWQVVEYWLNKHEWTGDADALAHAEANALLAFLMMCPKQLSWVKNPTQTSHAEQQHYLQYSNYCYTNAKIACLRRLGRFTRRKLYQDLGDRVMQCGFWAQEAGGEWMGCQYERMSDPWHGVSRDYDSKGTRYLSELAVEQALQLIEQGLAKANR